MLYAPQRTLEYAPRMLIQATSGARGTPGKLHKHCQWAKSSLLSTTSLPVRGAMPLAHALQRPPSRQLPMLCQQYRSKSAHVMTGDAEVVSDEINFLDGSVAFASKSTLELVRAWAIFKICSVGAFVRHSETMYNMALRVFGNTLTLAVVRRSFFGHFCAGEDTVSIAPNIEALRRLGVGSILDYAAEAELSAAATPQSQPSQEDRQHVTARVYTYASEEEADRNAKVFADAVRAVRDTSPEGFAAVKVSGLGDPRLLERISTSLVEMRSFFKRMRTLDRPDSLDSSDTTWRELTYEEFRRGWEHFFSVEDEASVRAAFDRLDVSGTGRVDWIDWTYSLTPEEISDLVKTCRETGPLSRSALNEKELKLLANLQRRVRDIVSLADNLGVRVMLDAEWVAIQPAIDHLALGLQREFNIKRPVIFNTYQAYLVNSLRDCQFDIQRSQREGWAFGAKVVRGAYMVSERARAKELGIGSPVWSTYEESEENFHNVIHEVLKCVRDGIHAGAPPAEMMVASHNRRSMQLVVQTMKDMRIPPSSGVYLGQLLGMADHITFTLGDLGYKAYKYVPYGPVDKVMPYLIRRTQENSTLLGSPGVAEERRLLGSELRRRLFGMGGARAMGARVAA